MMKAISKLLGGGKRASLEDPRTALNGSNVSSLVYGQGSAKVVTELTALNSAAVYSCVRILANTIASLPLEVFKISYNDMGQRIETRMAETMESELLGCQPNPNMSAFNWLQVAIAHMELWGNHYSYLARNSYGGVMEIRPLLPYNVAVFWKDNKICYRYQPTGDIVAPEDMLHFRALSLNGYIGISTVACARRSMGMALSQDEFGAAFYENNATPGLMFTHPSNLSPDAHSNLKKSIEDHSGSAKAFKAMILEEGMKVDRTQMTMTDAQFIESRRFSVNEIARWFGVPPHLVGDLDRSTNNNIEQQSIEFVNYSLKPRLTNIMQELNRKIFGSDRSLCAKSNMDELMGADTKTRADYISRMTQGGGVC